jgi:hypothetical protein
MTSAETIGLEARQLDRTIGARERNSALLKKILRTNDDPFVPFLIEREVGTHSCSSRK